MEDFPAVTTFGIKELERGLARARAELKSGAVIHLVSKSGGPRGGTARHRAWITPEADPGYKVEPVSCGEFLKNLSVLLDMVQETGIALEVRDTRAGVIAFYCAWCPPEVLARQPAVLQFYVRSRIGRALLREFASPVAAVTRSAS